MPHVRLVQPSDLAAILAISNDAAARTPANFAVQPEPIEMWRTAWQEAHETHPWLLATAGEYDAEVLGFARASPWLGRGAYDWSVEVTVYVRPEHHGRGIGAALYDRLFAILRAQGYRTAIAGIALPNAASVALHERYGLRLAGRFERIGWKFGRWHDVGYWVGHFGDDAPPGTLRAVSDVIGEGAGMPSNAAPPASPHPPSG